MVYAIFFTNIKFKVFLVWSYLVYRWGLKFSICNIVPCYLMSNPKCIPNPKLQYLGKSMLCNPPWFNNAKTCLLINYGYVSTSCLPNAIPTFSV
jgi:hypothetical protein